MHKHPGTVYLLHFARAVAGARHYIGYSEDVEARLEAHRRGRGARLTKAAARQGVAIELAATFGGKTRADERRMKRRNQHKRLCPLCRAEALARHAADEREARKAGRRGKGKTA